jgi:outer membrane lipoprotein-sorting protein
MKHVFLPILLSLVLVPAAARTARAQTADDIIEKHLAAIGGRDALLKITTRRSTGTVTVSTPNGDIPGTAEFTAKAPNKSRVRIELDLTAMGMPDKMVIDQKFDGTNGVALNSMQGESEISANQLDNMRNNIFPTSLLTYKQLGFKMELLPKEQVNGKDAFVIRATPKAGSVTKLYFDATSYMLVKSVATINAPAMGGDVEQTSEQSDFRKVDGITLPFQIVRSDPNQVFTIKFTKIEHNVPVDDKIFSR